jgi:hypothetical protein
MPGWSEKDRAEIIERIDQALPAYKRATGRSGIRLSSHGPMFNVLFSISCVIVGLVIAFWVFPARPAVFIVKVPIFPLFGATAMARWLGGTIAGWCSAVLSMIAIAYLWLPSLGIEDLAWLFGISLTFACVAVSSAGSSSTGHISSSGGRKGYSPVPAD